MTSRERVLKTLNFEKVDRLPVHGDAPNKAVQEYFGGERLTEENKNRVSFNAALKIFDIAVGLPVISTPAIVEQDGWTTEIQEWTSWIQKRPFSTSEECVQDMQKIIDNTDPDGIDAKQNRKEYACWIKLTEDFRAKDSVFGMWFDVGIQCCYHRYGLELFSYAYADYPELVARYIDVKSRYNLNRVLPLFNAETCPLFELGSDIAFKTGLLFSPQFLRKHYVPYLERAAAAFHAKGIKVYAHSDGNLTQIMDDMVAAGIDGLHSIEPASGMSLKAARKRFKDLILLAGIDCRVMAFGTPEEVKKEVRSAIEAAGPRYFVAVAGNIYEGIPVDNVKAMLEVVRGE